MLALTSFALPSRSSHAIEVLINDHVPNFVYLKEADDVLHLRYGVEAHIKHLLREFHRLFNADQILLVIILLHHFLLNLLALFQEQDPASLDVLHDEYLLLEQSLNRILNEAELEATDAVLLLQHDALVVVGLNALLQGLGLLLIEVSAVLQLLLQLKDALLLLDVLPGDL